MLLKATFNSKIELSCMGSMKKWFSEFGVWLLPGHSPDLNPIQHLGWIGKSVASQALLPTISAQRHLCSCGWMGENPCSQVQKSCGKPPQKIGGCYSRILMSFALEWDVSTIKYGWNVQMSAYLVCASTHLRHIVKINRYIINVTLHPKCLVVLHLRHLNDSGLISPLEVGYLWTNGWINEWIKMWLSSLMDPCGFQKKNTKGNL